MPPTPHHGVPVSLSHRARHAAAVDEALVRSRIAARTLSSARDGKKRLGRPWATRASCQEGAGPNVTDDALAGTTRRWWTRAALVFPSSCPGAGTTAIGRPRPAVQACVPLPRHRGPVAAAGSRCRRSEGPCRCPRPVVRARGSLGPYEGTLGSRQRMKFTPRRVAARLAEASWQRRTCARPCRARRDGARPCTPAPARRGFNNPLARPPPGGPTGMACRKTAGRRKTRRPNGLSAPAARNVARVFVVRRGRQWREDRGMVDDDSPPAPTPALRGALAQGVGRGRGADGDAARVP